MNAILNSSYKALCNLNPNDVRKPGTATIWHSSLDAEVTNLVTCRIQLLRLNHTCFLNIYAPSGTQGQKGRRDLFLNDIYPYLLANKGNLPSLIGDFNCVTDPQDVSNCVFGGQIQNSNVKSHYQQKKSKELKQIIDSFSYKDTFLLYNPKNNVGLSFFTWLRKGSRPLRLDRFYILEHWAVRMVSCYHMSHLSDHKALISTMHFDEIDTPHSYRNKNNDSFWKLNSKILDERDFERNYLNCIDLLSL